MNPPGGGMPPPGVTGEVVEDAGVPGEPYSLGTLQLTQALGDLSALRQRGRPAIRLHLRDRQAGIAQLLAAASTDASFTGGIPTEGVE